MRNGQRQLFSHPEYIETHLTKAGCDMSTNKEYNKLILPQKFSSGDYLFSYYADDNNVVGLIQITTESADTPEDEIPDEDVIDTMVYDMLESREHEKW